MALIAPNSCCLSCVILQAPRPLDGMPSNYNRHRSAVSHPAFAMANSSVPSPIHDVVDFYNRLRCLEAQNYCKP
ncbi:hypothetical protein CHS0354_039896 [Potamilus streckersoni]|uniref:Uncharacterized protein n=1 Tax=Potamilus streckersoni TaxID=2493646 RepID=A0AAE0TGT3_9BIVA|nr:hypothetical protein CHS0354_039896 [Potamilus streckersoni]